MHELVIRFDKTRVLLPLSAAIQIGPLCATIRNTWLRCLAVGSSDSTNESTRT